MQAPAVLDARAEAVYPGIRVAGIALLLKGYHRSLARRLCENLDLDGAATQTALHGLNWLHPQAARAGWKSGPVPNQARTLLLSDLAAGKSKPPPLEHVNCQTAQDWSVECVKALETAPVVAVNPPKLRLSEMPLSYLEQHCGETIEQISKLWPEAGHELELMVRAIVHVQGGEFKSAAFQGVYGAIFLGERELASMPATLEALVHEAGHHALYLRSAFEMFLTNPADMASHPLRPDPRPVEAAFHAVFVLERMATIFDRWREHEQDVPAQVLSRRDTAVEFFHNAMIVLAEKARWTEAGQHYFDFLMRRKAELKR